MSEPVKKKVKVLKAKYVKEAESIAIVGECDQGRLIHQIHKSAFSFGNRSEAEITREMEKTAAMMVGKCINIVYDPDLNGRIEDHIALKY